MWPAYTTKVRDEQIEQIFIENIELKLISEFESKD